MITIVETDTFRTQAAKVWNQQEYDKLIAFLAHYPNSGAIVPGSGGVRKLRWPGLQRGKRGGIRVIYYRNRADELWLITLYAKQQRETMSAEALAKLRKGIDEDG